VYEINEISKSVSLRGRRRRNKQPRDDSCDRQLDFWVLFPGSVYTLLKQAPD